MNSFPTTDELAFPVVTTDRPPAKPSDVELEVMRVFEQLRGPLMRYALSFRISVHDAEEVVQEVFLSLFHHLQSGKPRTNLRGWTFRVTHNLSLKQRYANQILLHKEESEVRIAEMQADRSPNPEERLSSSQRMRHLQSVVDALAETDQSCLRLRAEGLRYREIAEVLGISLGSVSISLTRSIAKLIRADGR